MTALHLIQLAGGTGSRARVSDQDCPKQFRSVGSRLLFQVSLEEFLKLKTPEIALASVTMTVDKAWRDTVRQVLADVLLPVQLAEPGPTRTASTWNAVQALRAAGQTKSDDLVAVHDAARPFASVRLLAALAEAALADGAAVPGVSVSDTILSRSIQGPAQYLDRQTLVAVQTPQVFRWDVFQEAHAWAAKTNQAFTDDGSLLAIRGHGPTVVEGEPANWKVTTTEDWDRAVVCLNQG